MRLIATQKFDRQFIKLVRKNKTFGNKVGKTLKLLKLNPSHSSLRLHKLKGRYSYSISVDMSYRIILNWRQDLIVLLEIGSHDDVY